MRTYTRKQVLRALKKDKDIYLYIGYFNWLGKETTKRSSGGLQFQKLNGWAAENSTKENMIFYKVKKGFASEFIYREIFQE